MTTTFFPAPRTWPAKIVVVAAVAALAWIWGLSDIARTDQVISTLKVVAPAAVAILLWVLVLAPWSLRTRLTIITAAALVALGCLAFFEVDGLTGDLLPQVRLRPVWRQLAGRGTVSLSPSPIVDNEAAGLEPVDLLTTTPQDSPQFLGPRRIPEVAGLQLARDWERDPPRELWRRTINDSSEHGAGWSAFAIVGNFAVTQEQRRAKSWTEAKPTFEEQVVCYEVLTGRERWRHRDPVEFVSVVGGDGPRATPTIVDGRVYTLGATGLLNCLDGATGDALWSRATLKAPGYNNEWGRSCSPLVYDRLVVVAGNGNLMAGDRLYFPALMAFDRATGEPLWQTGNDLAGHSSPVLSTLDGVEQIVVFNHRTVSGHDPHSGEVLWSFPFGSGDATVANAMPFDPHHVFVSAGYGVGCVTIDVRRDSAGQWQAREAWPANKNLKMKFTNGVIYQGHVLGLDDGVLACVNPLTGARTWKRGRYGHGQILLVGDLLLVLTEGGELVLVDARPDRAVELGRVQVFDDKTWNNLALSGNRLLLRNDREAVCLLLPLAKAPVISNAAQP
ncbi:MAG: PQQ-like beta-propeller repeat protein [Pirellulales bacterium]|nr:PQQ-like beta-propeller repeat protein [Pirellulales bacterium]